MRKKEYIKKLDAHMAKIMAHLKKMKCPEAEKIRKELIELDAEIAYTDTGLVLNTAINVARKTLKKVYEVSKYNVGPIQEIIEAAVKGDPFYGDIIKPPKTYDKHGNEIRRMK